MGTWYRITYAASLDVSIMVNTLNNKKFYDYVHKLHVDILDNQLYNNHYYLVFVMKEKYADANIIEFCKFLDPFVLSSNDPFLGIIQSDCNEDWENESGSLYGKLIMKGNIYHRIYEINGL